jgi:hypothetical protein
MSVTIGYTGRFGNNIFQYVNARLFAEKWDLQLKTEFPHPEIIKFKKQIGSLDITYPTIYVTEDNLDYLLQLDGGKHAHFDFNGFFQQSKRYMPYRNQIKSWLVKPYKTTNFKDIVIHLRADDYGKAHRIHPDWFLNTLSKETFDKIYIVSNPIDKDYYQYFANRHLDAIWISDTVKHDFEFIASFNKIICSNSTFCWWAAFLGNPERVYTFAKWLPNNPQIDLTELPNGIVFDGDFWE